MPLKADWFLTTDGEQGITVWHWKEGESLPDGKGVKRKVVKVTYEMAAPPAAAPLVLPAEKEDPQRVCVVDTKGTVTLLNVGPEGQLVPNGSWDLGGTVTAGPFLARRRTECPGSAAL